MAWFYKDIPDSLEMLDKLWFEANPDREFLIRRVQYEEERTDLKGVFGDILVVLMRCDSHQSIHRTLYMFHGECKLLRLESDEACRHGISMIMADPDGPGN